MKIYLKKYCQIKDRTFSINGETVFKNQEAETNHDFLTHLYRETRINYPKFFKMDNLAKTGFLAADQLLKDTWLYGEAIKQNMGIFISNSSSSLDTDCTYQNTIGVDYFPSPSVFIYTLPNILIGEIAIKHKIYGENTFFVSEHFDCQLIYDYIYQSFLETDMENALVGWADYYGNTCEALLLLVEKKSTHDESAVEFTLNELEKLFITKLDL
jgi:hypothetical protein